MKRLLSLAWLGAASAGSLLSATAPLYNNTSPLTAPPVPVIDARAFVNSSQFDIPLGAGLENPFETYNTLFYTNTSSGVMSAYPSMRFNYLAGGTRYPSSVFINEGSLYGSTMVSVYATNVVNSGLTETSFQGLIRNEGKNLDLSFARLSSSIAGDLYGLGLGGGVGFFGLSYGENEVNQAGQIVGFDNAPGVTDLFWGVGTGYSNGDPIPPTQFASGFSSPSFRATMIGTPQSPGYQTTTDFLSLGLYSTHVFAYTNRATNIFVQIVHVGTNLLGSNVSMGITFDAPNLRDQRTRPITVEFHAPEYDSVHDVWLTNYVYLIDSTGSSTNLFNNDNQGTSTFRPSSIELIRSYGSPYFGTGFYTNNTDSSDIALLYSLLGGPGFVLDEVNNNYVDYSGTIDVVPVPDYQMKIGLYPQITNYPGRIELLGDKLNLDQAQIRGEAAAVIRTKNLVNNQVGMVDAPNAVFDLASVEPLMVVTNLAPGTVGRFFGNVSCYSTTWGNRYTNAVVTNTYVYQVLYLAPALIHEVPVTTWELSLKATNIIVADTLSVRDKFYIDATSLDNQGQLYLPFGASWASSNVVKLLHLTNNGFINIPAGGYYGSDRTNAYTEFINAGTNSTPAQYVRANLFDNHGLLYASSGLLSVNALQGRMTGPPTDIFQEILTNIFTDPFTGLPYFTNYVTNIAVTSLGPRLTGGADVEIFAHDFTLSNALITAGSGARGGLRWTVTNSLIDAGPSAISDWTVTAGFQMNRLPVTSSLLGTWLHSFAANNQPVDQYWAATNRGAVAVGYTNNLALGKLELDGRPGSRFRFHGAGTNRAIYVDYLELKDNATNYNNGTSITVDPGFTVYFANANVSVEKLNGAVGGRFQWVPSFAGPLSSTNITYPSGTTYTFNVALVSSKNLDSDGDGIVNGDDPTPIYVDESVGLTIAYTNLPPVRPVLNWNGLYSSSNAVLYVTNVTATNWQVLTNIVIGPINQPVSYIDRSATNSQRYYRVRVTPPPLL